MDVAAVAAGPQQDGWQASRSVSVIVPTRNEADNVGILARRLANSLAEAGLAWELIFVDDSDDETTIRIKALLDEQPLLGVIHRPPGERRGGLAGAVVEGFLAARGEVLVVMDGDLQHPPEVVPALATAVLNGRCSVAVGSRYVNNAPSDGLSGPIRRIVSKTSRSFVRILFPSIRKVHDPLSGLFALQQRVIQDVVLAPEGFKILLEVLIRGQWEKVLEVPYEFAARTSGYSKAGWPEGRHFLRQMLRLRLAGIVGDTARKRVELRLRRHAQTGDFPTTSGVSRHSLRAR